MRLGFIERAGVALLAIVLAHGAIGAPRRGGPIPPKGTAAAFQAEMEKAGFIVQPGKFEYLDPIKLYLAGISPSCYGNNPSSPYLTAKLPMGPNQPDPGFILISDKYINPANNGLFVEQMLRPTEAVVLVGVTPPEMKYFSYRSYVARRYVPWENVRRRIYASLGDSLNNLTIATSGTPNGTRGNPFNQETVIITTADRSVDARIREAAVRAGFPKPVLNTDVIPSSLLKMGWGNKDDTFNVLMRMAFPTDQALGDQYIAQPPLAVFRVTPKLEPAPDPFEVPTLKPRGSGTPEFEVREPDGRSIALMPALDELRKVLLAKYANANTESKDLKVDPWIMDGYMHMQSWTDAMGDNRDTIYLRTEPFLLGEDDFIMVYGVNHARTGKAVYSNFAMYGTKAMNGIGSVSDQDYSDTAEAYLPGNPAAKYLYVWKVSRREGANNLFVPVMPPNLAPYGVGLDEPGLLAFRVYVEKATTVGPSWAEVVFDRAIRFSSQ